MGNLRDKTKEDNQALRRYVTKQLDRSIVEFQAVLKAGIENGHKIEANKTRIDKLERLIDAYNKELKEKLPKVETNEQLA